MHTNKSKHVCEICAREFNRTIGTITFDWLSDWIAVSKAVHLHDDFSVKFVLSIISYSIPHGVCSCLTLAGVVTVQSKYLDDDKVKQLASLLPFISIPKAGNNFRENALQVALEIGLLITDLDLKGTLREYKVPQSDLDGIVERALPNGKQDVRFQAFAEVLRSIY